MVERSRLTRSEVSWLLFVNPEQPNENTRDFTYQGGEVAGRGHLLGKPEGLPSDPQSILVRHVRIFHLNADPWEIWNARNVAAENSI